MTDGVPGISFVTTCMGRLPHLEACLPSWLGQPGADWTVVDWSCPQQCGAWLREHHPRVRVVEVPGQRFFNHSKARNAGFRALAGSGAEWVCFLDADNRLAADFTGRVRPLLERGSFVTGYGRERSAKGLGGLLIVHRDDFERAGGYDETIEGSGTNGAEMRVRLFFRGNGFHPLPPGLVEHVPHVRGPEQSRYAGDRLDSLIRNTTDLVHKIEGWERETGLELPDALYDRGKLRRLLERREARRRSGTEPAPLPRFSIVIETANLAGRAELAGLEDTLRSLDAQTLSPASAEEVLLMVQPEELETAHRLRERFPWVQPRALPGAPPGTQEYYRSKMEGTRAATGEVVVLFDSDCTYAPTALARLVETLAADEKAVAVSGHSYLEIDGVHALAMSIAFVFEKPEALDDARPAPSGNYTANIVAFRRQVLLDHPIRSDLPAYRGSHLLQARELRRHGLPMLRRPDVLSIHPPPSLGDMGARFAAKGHDAVRIRLISRPGRAGAATRARIAGRVLARRYARWARKTARTMRSDPRQLPRLPLALLLVAYAGLAFGAGALATASAPGRAYRRFVLPAGSPTASAGRTEAGTGTSS